MTACTRFQAAEELALLESTHYLKNMQYNKRVWKNPVARHQILTLAVMATGGGVGGIGNQQLGVFNGKQQPTGLSEASLVTQFAFLGAIAGVIGTNFVLDRLKKNALLMQVLAIALSCGLSFPALLNGLKNLILLQVRVNSLQAANTQIKIDRISNLNQIAIAPTPAKQKAFAVNEVAEIARTTTQPQVKASAIETISEVSSVSNPQIQRGAINKLRNLAITSEDKNITADIISQLETYIDPQFPKVSESAKNAILELSTSKKHLTKYFPDR